MNLVRVKYYAIEKQSEIEFYRWLNSVEWILNRALRFKRSIGLVSIFLLSRALKTSFRIVKMILEEPALYRHIAPGTIPERIEVSERRLQAERKEWRAF